MATKVRPRCRYYLSRLARECLSGLHQYLFLVCAPLSAAVEDSHTSSQSSALLSRNTAYPHSTI
eukprot:13540544-Ditylum_brightwellii.AAC.1